MTLPIIFPDFLPDLLCEFSMIENLSVDTPNNLSIIEVPKEKWLQCSFTKLQYSRLYINFMITPTLCSQKLSFFLSREEVKSIFKTIQRLSTPEVLTFYALQKIVHQNKNLFQENSELQNEELANELIQIFPQIPSVLITLFVSMHLNELQFFSSDDWRLHDFIQNKIQIVEEKQSFQLVRPGLVDMQGFYIVQPVYQRVDEDIQ